MKKFLALLLGLSILAEANTPFTLSEIDKLYVVVENGTTLVDKKTEAKLKQMMFDTLHRLGVKTEGYAPEQFLLMIGSFRLDYEEVNLLKMQLLIASQVKRRNAKDEVLGITYMNNDLFDTTEPNKDAIESLEFMLSQFEEQFKEEQE